MSFVYSWVRPASPWESCSPTFLEGVSVMEKRANALGHHWSLGGREGSSCEQVPCSSSIASSLGQAEHRKGL